MSQTAKRVQQVERTMLGKAERQLQHWKKIQERATKQGLTLDEYANKVIRQKEEGKAKREAAEAKREDKRKRQQEEQRQKQQASRDLISLEQRQAAMKRLLDWKGTSEGAS